MTTRNTLDREIRLVQDETLLLGNLVEQAVLNSVETLKSRDAAAAKAIIRNDAAINDKRFAIENRILLLFATHSPMARDLRLLAAELELITELERIGDYAKGIAKVAVELANQETRIPIQEISDMADLAVSMLHRALEAFITEDLETARKIPIDDDQVDELYKRIYHEIIQSMVADPGSIDRANQIVRVIHN
ncbi:MAG: phosphate signaling complex protein PhoU, partial [Anaerolineales bacterium]|nr:phosphate signaling complex protein PhoU [Anaerolineales bacterium]